MEYRPQIERVVYTAHNGRYAEFKIANGFYLCQALIGDTPYIHATSAVLTPERALALRIALGMALEWIAEENAKAS